jgi:hypothetical protein
MEGFLRLFGEFVSVVRDDKTPPAIAAAASTTAPNAQSPPDVLEVMSFI